MTLKCATLLLICFIFCLQGNCQDNSQNWQLSQQYTPPDVRNGNLFGNAVDIYGNYAIASAHRHSPIINGDTIKQAGAVYLFEKDGNNNWNEAQKLTAPDAVAYDYFGIDVGISGTTAIIGADYNSSDANNENRMPAAGAVYVFERDNDGIWQFWQKLTASDRDTLDKFGSSLHVYQNQLMVSAPIKDDEALAVGCVYYFAKNEEGKWVEQQKIKPPEGKEHIRFGTTLHFNDDVLVIGTPFESGLFPITDGLNEVLFNQHGAAYIYEFNENKTWSFAQKLLLERMQLTQSSFGQSVAVTTCNNKSYVFIGHPRWISFDRENYGTQSKYTGGVHLYAKTDKSNWALQETIIPTADSFEELSSFFSFGSDINVDSNTLIVTYGNKLNDFPITLDVFNLNNKQWKKTSDIAVPILKFYQPDIAISNNNIIVGVVSDPSSIFTFSYDVMPSVTEINKHQQPIIYPNPVNSVLYINKNEYNNLKKIQITSVNGAILFDRNYTILPNEILFKHPAGTYFLTAIDTNNKIYSQQIIKY